MKNNSKAFESDSKRDYLGALEVTVNGGNAKEAIYWGSEKKLGTLSTVEAQELIEVLQAIIADYPKGPTNEEILNELPNGSIIQFDDEKSRWVKTNSGILLSGDTSMEGNDLSIYEGLKITVKYRGDE